MLLFATFIASSDKSIATISAFSNSLAKEIAIAPDPVPISNILKCAFLSLNIFKDCSIIPSVSGRGSKTHLFT